LIQVLHLHRAAEMSAGGGNAMKGVLLAKDEDAFVFDELRTLGELIQRADLEALWIFIKNVWYE
jgi:thiamine biosynthesis protein ThiC